MTEQNKPQLVDMLTRPENLHWAWLKARNIYDYADFWFDEAEVSEFDACLQFELDNIAAQFRDLTYKMSPLRPLPYPKQLNQVDSDGVKLRQMFHISVRDQVAWIAFVNVIGPWLESQMPAWSYGNRLYQARWPEKTDKGYKLNVGPHRHARGRLYRTFNQSWPPFRRHIFLTVREMSGWPQERSDLTPADRNVLEAENTLPADEKLTYLKKDYWGKHSQHVFWAGLDIKKFYPNLSCEPILTHLSKAKQEYTGDIHNLAKALLHFPVDYTECGDVELEKMGLNREEEVFDGLPTGLFVAGFLANSAMLGVDSDVASELEKQRKSGNASIAHFRYVDDHVVLARSFEDLESWVNSYEKMLREHSPTLTINQNKLQPEEFKSLRENKEARNEDEKRQKAKKACSVDPRYPAPLITKTLGMVSNLAQVHFDILDSREREHFIGDLEHLLLAEFPDHEIREVTRVSFAAGRLANSGARRSFFSFEISELEREIAHLSASLNKLRHDEEKLKDATRNKIQALERRKQQAEETLRQQREREEKRTMSLLVQAIKKHPEKLKLWTAALEFCRRTGHDGLSLIAEDLNMVAQTSEEAGAYVRAFLWQKMARQVMKSTKQGLMSVKEMDVSHASDSLVYPFELPHKLLTFVSETNRAPRFFESSSWLWLRSTLGAFRTETLGVLNSLYERPHLDKMLPVEFVEKLNEWVKDLSETRGDGVGDYCKELQKIDDKMGLFLKEKFPSPPSKAIFLWWWDKLLVEPASSQPSKNWLEQDPKLVKDDPTLWNVWWKYPQHLPKEALQYLHDLRSFRPHQFRWDCLYYSGWLFDVVQGILKNHRDLDPLIERSLTFYKVIEEAKTPEGWTALYEWADMAHKFHSNDPWDPRAGEWTSLEIVSQVGKLIPKHENRTTPIHPANFLIPRQWFEDENKPPSWERWRRIARESRIMRKDCLKSESVMFHDERFTPKEILEVDEEYAQVRGLAVLLLGLLGRSFTWPAAWNPFGHQILLHGLFARIRETQPCSWITVDILKACLAPRSAETRLLNWFQRPGTEVDDKEIEPPPIPDIETLILRIKQAQASLELDQISVSRDTPRQMVRAKLRQIKPTQWLEQVAEYNIVEEHE